MVDGPPFNFKYQSSVSPQDIYFSLRIIIFFSLRINRTSTSYVIATGVRLALPLKNTAKWTKHVSQLFLDTGHRVPGRVAGLGPSGDENAAASPRRPASCPGEVLRPGPGCWAGRGRAQGRAGAGRCWHRKEVEWRTGLQRAWSWVCSPLQTEEDEGSDDWQSVTKSAPAQPQGWHRVEERDSLSGRS